MEAPDLQKTIAFVSSFTDLYMLFAGMALIFLTFQAIYHIGFKKIKLAKVFGQYFIKTHYCGRPAHGVTLGWDPFID
jgi:hypothetical protein